MLAIYTLETHLAVKDENGTVTDIIAVEQDFDAGGNPAGGAVETHYPPTVLGEPRFAALRQELGLEEVCRG